MVLYMNKNSIAYIESEKLSKGRTMQAEIAVDKKTGEPCVTGYDGRNKMRVTLLFQSDAVVDTEKVITEALKRNFMERIKMVNDDNNQRREEK